MKKYHLADLLTLGEALFTVVIIACAIAGAASQWAFLAFAAGELCDAFDGICARK